MYKYNGKEKRELVKGIAALGVIGIIIGVCGNIDYNAETQGKPESTEINTQPATETETEIMLPVSDFAEVYMGADGYLCFSLKDVGNIADDPSNPSYEEIAREINGTETREELQKYVVRYGFAYDAGATIITEDGNNWYLDDAPYIEEGKEVRVLFDSNGTYNVEDDIIIDVTERK